MFSFSKRLNQKALIGAGLVLGLWSTSASAQVNVDCGSAIPPNSIQAAIGLGNVAINVTGTCNETVSIRQSNVSIFGAPSAVITGGLSVEGATGVVLTNLTINGNNLASGSGVFVLNGAYVQFTNVTLEDLHNGVILIRNAGAIFINSRLRPSLVDDPRFACDTLCLSDNSDVRLQGTTVTGDTDNPGLGGALVGIRNSSIVLRGGNTITNNGTLAAIAIDFDTSLRQDDLFILGSDAINGGTDGVAVQVRAMSLADLRQATVNGGIAASEQSLVRLGSTVFGDPSQLVINGDIALSFDSGLRVLSPLVTIVGDVTCEDRESSLAGTFAGGGEINCTGFDPSAAKGGGGD